MRVPVVRTTSIRWSPFTSKNRMFSASVEKLMAGFTGTIRSCTQVHEPDGVHTLRYR